MSSPSPTQRPVNRKPSKLYMNGPKVGSIGDGSDGVRMSAVEAVYRHWPRPTAGDIKRLGHEPELLLVLVLDEYHRPRDELERLLASFFAREMTP